MTGAELPEGYVDIGNAAVPIEDIERFTSDLDRFLKFLPFVKEIKPFEIGSDAWLDKMGELQPEQLDDRRYLPKLKAPLADTTGRGRKDPIGGGSGRYDSTVPSAKQVER